MRDIGPFSNVTRNIFSREPMSFLTPDHVGGLSKLAGIVALETSRPAAWAQWQGVQLENLLKFVMKRSIFWQTRLQSALNKGEIDWSKVPMLTKGELRQQFDTEGSLFTASDKMVVNKHQTSGSSGIPTEFFISQWNADFNFCRSFATYIIEGRPFDRNRTQPKLKFSGQFDHLKTERHESWAGSFASFFKTGSSRIIDHKPVTNSHGDETLARLKTELEKEDIGYFIANAWTVECLLSVFGAGYFEKTKTFMWIPIGAMPSGSIRDVFSELNIPVRATYSCEEIGTIGTECPVIRGCYHVAVSNVHVDIDPQDRINIEGTTVGRVLLTHLHSYATPFIKYDVGDVARLEPKCACGHQGPTLRNLLGRGKNLVRLPDGSSTIFSIQLWNETWLSRYKEFRFRQTQIDVIQVELATEEELTKDEVGRFEDLIGRIAGPSIKTRIICLPALEWGREAKRNLFYSDIS